MSRILDLIQRHLWFYRIISLVLILAAVVLGILWIRNPQGNYEPWIFVIGTLAALIGVPSICDMAGLTRKRSKADMKGVIIVAKEAASRFDYWMKNYTHYGNSSDKQKLLEWLVSDKGHIVVADDYLVFTEMASLLHKQGYDTQPPPTKIEFKVALRQAQERESR